MKTLLFLLIFFITITSISSGLLMISSTDGTLLNLSLVQLKGTPFRNFLIPGILLTVIVGGISLIALFFNMKHTPNRYNWAVASGMATSGWVIIQMLLIQTTSWSHFLYLCIGVLIVLLAYQLKGKWAV